MKKVGWILIAVFAIFIGLYPALYFLVDMGPGFLSTKPPEILKSDAWNFLFKQHILLGGIALLTGWSQFNKNIRNKRLRIHRTLGKIYVISCLLSGSAGLYLAMFANGGIVSILGFGGLALSWLLSTSMAYIHIRNKKIDNHEKWMVRSYALTFAAVMLRLLIPTFAALGFEFISAYRIISWLCWVPNILVAEWIISRRKVATASA